MVLSDVKYKVRTAAYPTQYVTYFEHKLLGNDGKE
jgi:hypothetical protein